MCNMVEPRNREHFLIFYIVKQNYFVFPKSICMFITYIHKFNHNHIIDKERYKKCKVTWYS